MERKLKVPGIVILTILLLMMAEFIGLLVVTKMVPTVLLLIVGIVFFVLFMIVFILVNDFRKKIRFILGAMLAILLLAIMVMGNLYIFSTINTLAKISNANTQTSRIGIYVRTDDPAQTLQDAADYTFGILGNVDTENTSAAVRQVNADLGKKIATVEYDGVMEQITALREGDCDAIVLNYAYIPVLEDIEGYENIMDEIRELTAEEVEVVLEEEIIDEKANPNILQVYISGIDTRGSSIINTRSDVNIVATINTETKQILLVSTPRDYFVPLSISGGRKDKLTHAGIYGTNVSMDTMNMLYDANIKYFFKVNFTGFVDIIDALGGVNVYSDYDFSTNGYHFSQGYNQLNGTQALAFARERYAFSEGDRQRGRNQMAVITAVLNKMMSPDLLTKYTSIMSSVEGSFETNMSYTKIADLVKQQLESPASWNIKSYSVDGTGDSQIPYSMSAYAYVMNPDQSTVDKAIRLMQQVKDGEEIDMAE